MSLYENSIRIKGFLGKDAMTKSITNGKIFVSFTVATKSSYKDRQTGEWHAHTDWHRVTAFGKPALTANNQQLAKGDYVEIEGELRSSEYTSKAGGKDTSRIGWEIRANSITKLAPPAKKPVENLDADPVEELDEAAV